MIGFMIYTHAGAAVLLTALTPALVAALPAPLPVNRDVGAAVHNNGVVPEAKAVVVPESAAPDPAVCLGIKNSTLKVCWDLVETDQPQEAAVTATEPPTYSTTPLLKRALGPLTQWSWLGWQHKPTSLEAIAAVGPTPTLHIDMMPAAPVPTTQAAADSDSDTSATATATKTTTSISTTCLPVTDSTKTVCVGSDELIFPPGMKLPFHHIPIPILSRHPITNPHGFSHTGARHRTKTTTTTTTPPPSLSPAGDEDEIWSFPPSTKGFAWNPVSWWSWAYHWPAHPQTSNADVTTFASVTGASTLTPTTSTTTTESLFLGPRSIAFGSASTPTPTTTTTESLLFDPDFIGPRDVAANADADIVIPIPHAKPPLPITKVVDDNKPPLPITKAVDANKPPVPITKAVDANKPPLPITKAVGGLEDYKPPPPITKAVEQFTLRNGDVKADLPGVPIFTAWGEGAGPGMAMPRPSIGVRAAVDEDEDEGDDDAEVDAHTFEDNDDDEVNPHHTYEDKDEDEVNPHTYEDGDEAKAKPKTYEDDDGDEDEDQKQDDDDDDEDEDGEIDDEESIFNVVDSTTNSTVAGSTADDSTEEKRSKTHVADRAAKLRLVTRAEQPPLLVPTPIDLEGEPVFDYSGNDIPNDGRTHQDDLVLRDILEAGELAA